MPIQMQEQVVHDRVNLGRLVKSLEGLVAGEEWQSTTQEPGRQTWIKVQAALHKVQYARKLLHNVEFNTLESSSTPTGRFDGVRSSLDRLEAVFQDVDKVLSPVTLVCMSAQCHIIQRVASKRFRPEPLLPTLPVPEPPTPRATLPLLDVDAAAPETLLSPGVPSAALSTHDLLLSPSDTAPDSAFLHSGPSNDSIAIPPSGRTSSSPLAPASTGAILQNSRAIQEELSEQLAQMATQLKRNALHFSNSLENDKAVVEEAQVKLERNYDVMTKERIRLRDHHAKSWGTTWITLLSILVVVIGFLLSFFVIRIT
ncbi:hypothetical protein EIP91_005616 [Steccherinum ochraceum]|uniref:t-SNARE coiled-coil homology domain-containing protein n=1 Tax=Steccherinum ochraceum TaxID=92696 RepID=A0A4R0RD26_9APHY|nr:hypothetical protein EIP91_005616 [Steccherinum ochraceum]